MAATNFSSTLARTIVLLALCIATPSFPARSAPPGHGGDSDVPQAVESDAATAPDLRWKLLDPFHSRPNPAIVLDSDRDRLILIGGGVEVDATWEMPLSGPYEWQHIEDAGSPTIRGAEQGIYDPVQRRMILYSVQTDGKYYARTLWQNLPLGSTTPRWSELPWAAFPYGTGWEHPGAAFDDRRGRHIFYGGYYSYSQYGYAPTSDVWALQSSTSQLIKLPIGTQRPPVRTAMGLIYDSQRDRIVTWGGGWYDDRDSRVWALGMSDNIWSILSTYGQAPPPMTDPGMVMDAANDRAIVLGGVPPQSSQPADPHRIWTLALATGEWKQWDTGFAPATLGLRPAVFMDTRRDRVIVVGHDSQGILEVWSLQLADQPVWQQLSRADPWKAPSARARHAMAIDDSSGIFIVGGRTQQIGAVYLLGTPYPRDVYLQAPSFLSPASTAWSTWNVPAFAAVEQPEVVFDSRERRFVHYGGKGDADPWSYCHHNCNYQYWYEDNVWASRVSGAPAFTRLNQTGNKPPSRVMHAMAYDALRHRIVVFGGFHHIEGYRSDLWAFDLTRNVWERLVVEGESPASGWYGFYDKAADRFLIIDRWDPMIVYALELGNTQLRWSRVAISGPALRLANYSYDVCLDDYRRRLLLAAQGGGVFALPLDAGGGPWQSIPVHNAFPSASGHQVVYDNEQDRLILNGGVVPRGGTVPMLSELPRFDTWFLEFGDPIRHLVVDVRPGSDEDVVNPRSHGLIPVAILGRNDYDAGTIDPETVRIGGAPIHRNPDGEWSASSRDVNGDGFMDLFVHVETESLQTSKGQTSLAMSGRGPGGRWRGNAPVRMVGPIDREGADQTASSSVQDHLQIAVVRGIGVVALSVNLPTTQAARLEVFDVMGRRVMEHEFAAARGRHEIPFEPKGGPGLYFARLRQGEVSVTTRLVGLR